DFEIDVLEIVLARAADRDYARAISRCLAARAALVEEVVHTVRRAINMGEAKAVIPTRPKPKKRPAAALRPQPPTERSKNGGVSLVRRAAAALPSLSCGQRPRHWPQCDVDTPERDGRGDVAGESFNGRASMKDVIAFILGNFTLTFFVLGLLASAIALWRARPPRPFALIVEALFSSFVLFSIGFSSLYNFVLHVFFGKLAASFIGWEDSPFQLRQPRLCGGGIAGVQGELRFAARGHRRARLLSLGRGRRARLSDDHGAQFRSWERRHHFLQRSLCSDRGLHISLAATSRRQSAATKVGVTAKMPVEGVALAGRWC